MANKLNATFRAALQGGTYDASKITKTLTLHDNGVSTEEVLTVLEVITAWGATEIVAFGMHPTESNEFENPQMSVAVKNETGRYSPGVATGLWPDGDVSGWFLRLELFEQFSTAAPVRFFRQEWLLEDVTVVHRGELLTAELLATHPLTPYLNRTWALADRDDMYIFTGKTITL